MEESNKLSLKRVEPSLTKFNEVIIPHHLDLLRQHKVNIVKYTRAGEWSRARAEQEAAGRACARLRSHVRDLDALRDQLSPQDARAFHAATATARNSTLAAIKDYLKTQPIPQREQETNVAASVTSGDSVGVLPDEEADLPAAPLDDLQLQIETNSLAERERTLESWTALQREVQALHEAWAVLHDAAVAQREPVAQVAENIETASENVAEGRTQLARAVRLRNNVVWVGGCAAALVAGGPVGLVLGIKAGAAAAVAGSLLAFAGAKLLNKDTQHDKTD